MTTPERLEASLAETPGDPEALAQLTRLVRDRPGGADRLQRAFEASGLDLTAQAEALLAGLGERSKLRETRHARDLEFVLGPFDGVLSGTLLLLTHYESGLEFHYVQPSARLLFELVVDPERLELDSDPKRDADSKRRFVTHLNDALGSALSGDEETFTLEAFGAEFRFHWLRGRAAAASRRERWSKGQTVPPGFAQLTWRFAGTAWLPLDAERKVSRAVRLQLETARRPFYTAAELVDAMRTVGGLASAQPTEVAGVLRGLAQLLGIDPACVGVRPGLYRPMTFEAHPCDDGLTQAFRPSAELRKALGWVDLELVERPAGGVTVRGRRAKRAHAETDCPTALDALRVLAEA
jgi:hypothetical protein